MILLYLLYKVFRFIIVLHEKINLKYRIMIFHFRFRENELLKFFKHALVTHFFLLKNLYMLKIIEMKEKFIQIFDEDRKFINYRDSTSNNLFNI